jgi:hypothetical protein
MEGTMENRNGAMVIHEAQAMTPFAPQGLEQAMQLAKTLATSGLMPNALKGKPQDILVTLITGHELGLSPMQAIRSIHIVQGRAVMSADLMVALAARSPACEWIRLTESTDKVATYEAKRRGAPEPVRLSFTIEQARIAGLASKDNWKNYPAAMLRARCSAAIVRAVFPDLALGVYEQDEAQDIEPTFTAPPPVASAASLPAAAAVTPEGEDTAPADSPSGEDVIDATAEEVVEHATENDPFATAKSVADLTKIMKTIPQDQRAGVMTAYKAASERIHGRA